MNWRGRPLTATTSIVASIGPHHQPARAERACELDTTTYPTGVKIPDAQMKRCATPAPCAATIGTPNGTTPSSQPPIRVSIIAGHKHGAVDPLSPGRGCVVRSTGDLVTEQPDLDVPWPLRSGEQAAPQHGTSARWYAVERPQREIMLSGPPTVSAGPVG